MTRRPPNRPSLKALKAAFEMNRPLDSTAEMPAKKKRFPMTREELEAIPDHEFFSASSVQGGAVLPEPEPVFPRHKDGIGGTDGRKK